jgi:hypothetical protein
MSGAAAPPPETLAVLGQTGIVGVPDRVAVGVDHRIEVHGP